MGGSMKKIYILLLVAILALTGCSQNELKEPPEGPIETVANKFVQDMLDQDTEGLLNDYAYNEAMAKAFTKELIENAYEDIDSRFGAFISRDDFRLSKEQGYDIVSYLSSYENGYVNHNVIFDEDKRIAGYNYVTAQAPEGEENSSENVDLETIAVNFALDLYEKETKKLLEVYPYDSAMKQAMTGTMINQMILDLEGKFGNYKEIWSTEQSEKSGYDVISVITEFENAFISLNVVFDSEMKIAGINYFETGEPNESSSNIAELDVTFGEEPWIINGKLTQPVRDVLIPAVVLVHGSGPNDMDETIYGNKPFKDIAEGLYAEGIAVLRYDKRTLTYGQEIFNNHGEDFTIYEETVEDAVYAMRYLKEVPGIDPDRIFVMGHSLGANQGPAMGMEEDFAGLLLVAGNVTPLHELMKTQYEYIFNLDGSLDASEVAALDQIASAVEKINSDNISDYPREDLLGINSKYWNDLKGYDPVGLASEIDVPIALFQGERDYQVPVSEFEMWKAGLPQADAYLYPSLNHLMIAGEGQSTPEEYLNAGHVDETFIKDMAEWIKAQ